MTFASRLLYYGGAGGVEAVAGLFVFWKSAGDIAFCGIKLILARSRMATKEESEKAQNIFELLVGIAPKIEPSVRVHPFEIIQHLYTIVLHI